MKPGANLKGLIVGGLLAGLAMGGLQAQTLLNFQESPAASGLLVAQDSAEYTATGQGNGVAYLLNGEGGDSLTVLVQTEQAINSVPRIRLADGDNNQIVVVTGSSGGLVILENYRLPAPGVYRLTVFSDTNPSSYDLQGMLGRTVALESENNDRQSLADVAAARAQPGGFELKVAGVALHDEDYYDLGVLAAGNSVNASVQLPNGSALLPGSVELSLFKMGTANAITSVTGAALNESIAETGRYAIRARVPEVEGLNLRLNGADHIDLGDPGSLRLTGSQTIEMWIKPDNFQARRNPVNKAYGGEGTMTIETDGTVNYFYGTAGGNAQPYQAFNTGAALRAGVWQHIALVRDLDAATPMLYWYVDGRKTAEAEALHVPAVASSLSFLIGNGYTNPLVGNLDELRIWSVPRTQQEIVDNLDNALVGNEAGLVSYYPFEEGDGATTIVDAGPGGNDGAPVGAPDWQGSAAATAAAAVKQGIEGIYLLEVDVTDAVNPSVTEVQFEPVSGYLFDGTSNAPTTMSSLRGNNDVSYLYTVTADTGSTVWGTDIYTDDSRVRRAAIHAGVLQNGETGAISVTIKPGEASYLGSTRFGVGSNSHGSNAGSFVMERYNPPGDFTLNGLYRRLWVQFSEPLPDDADPADAIELLGAGPDGAFGTSDDLGFAESVLAITHDNRVRIDLGGVTLGAGLYRLTVADSVSDRAGNTLGAAYTEDFTVLSGSQEGIDFVNESDANESFVTADDLSLNVMPGVMDGSFLAGEFAQSSEGTNPYDVEVADLDQDGHLDAVVSYLGADGVRIFAGNGDGTLSSIHSFPPGTGFQEWEATYFDNNDFTGTTVTRTDPEINFNWGSGSPDPAIEPDQWSARWIGSFVAPRAGTYRLRAQTDDSKRVWVDLDRSGTFEESEKLLDTGLGTHWTAAFEVVGGLDYGVQMEFIEFGGNASAYLSASESMTVLFGDANEVEFFDLENDGDLDIAVAVNPRDVVEIFRNDSTAGAIIFTQLPGVAVGDGPVRIQKGDLNADTFDDLVVSNVGTNNTTGRNVSVLLNDQSGGFTEAKAGLELIPRVRPYGVALGLLNNDAHLDLVTGDYDNTDRVSVWLGNGDGTFADPIHYDFPNEWEPIDIVLADYNQDGNLDAGVAAHSGSSQRVYFYPGKGDGTFDPFVEHHLGRGADLNFLKSPDLNGDGYPDVVTGDGSRFFQLTNQADGTISFARRQWALGSTYGFDHGDMNEDGRLDLVVAVYNTHQLRILTGNAKSQLAGDDTLTGVQHGYGRGSLSDGNDNDYYRFSALAGQRMTVAVDNTELGGSNLYTRFILYNEQGDQISDNYVQNSSNRTGQSSPYTIPRDGTYYIRFLNWANYFGEYRFRVSLSPADAPVETENNDSLGNADGVSFTLNGNQLSGKIFGYVAHYDTNGDYYQLGNLAAGTRIDVDLTQPSTSTLVSELRLYKTGGVEVPPDNVSATHLDFTLQPGDESTYYVRVLAESGRGMMAEYFVDFLLTDTVPPSIVSDTLPDEGSTQTFASQNFTLNFSEDMLAGTVNDAANYELLGSGGDGTFSDGNEETYTVVPGGYSSGLSNSYHVPDGPFQPDSYRFRASTGLKDKLNNPLAATFERTWTVEGVPGFVLESRQNGSFVNADDLSVDIMSGVFDGSFLYGEFAQSSEGTNPYDVEVTDLDQDGHLDVVVSYLGSDGVRIFAGNGDGTLSSIHSFPPGTGFQAWEATYFDNNDFTGTTVTRTDPEINFNWGSGSPDPAIEPDQWSARWIGSFVAPRAGTYRLRCQTDDSKRVWVDLDRSGTFEESEKLLDTGGGTHWTASFEVVGGLDYGVQMEFIEFGGNASAYLSVSESMTVLFGNANEVEFFDLENDGDLDFAVAVNPRDVVEIFRNDSTAGTIIFKQLPGVAVGDGPVRIRNGDVNADSFDDLVVSNVGTNNTTGRHVSVLLNDQAGGFTETKAGLELDPRVRPYGIELGLLNDDAHLDLVTGDYDNTDRVSVWLGNGDGTFADPAHYDFPNEWEPIDIVLADYDQDGNLDAGVAAHSGSARRVYFYPGNGDGTFDPFVEHDLGRGADLNFLKSPDLNGDGYPDVITGDGSRFFQLTNRADGTISFARRQWALGSTYGFDHGDMNEDGRVDLVVAVYNTHQLRILTGNAKSLLAADDTLTGVQHGYGRGSLTDGNDSDYYRFSAVAGQRLTVAVDNTPLGGGNRYTRFILYTEQGDQISDNYIQNSSNRAGQSPPYTIPRDGTYYIRFLNWANYFGEYRFRVSLSPADAPVETENNDSLGNADGVSFALNGNQLSGTIFGYAAIYDTNGDYYNLGNLAAGTRIDVDLTQPSTSTLVSELRLYKTGGTEVTPDNVSATHLDYTLQAGDESTYYVRVLAESGRGVMAEYFVDFLLSDTVPPTIVGDTLPGEGSVQTFVSQNFTLNFSEDMLASTVTDGANYELLGSGGDGTFSDGNEESYTVVPGGYSSGLSNSYHVPDGPFQPDLYRFRALTGLKDKLNNPLAATYERSWTVEGVPGFPLESRQNGSFVTADSISLNVMPGVFDGSFLDEALTRGSSGNNPYDLELADFDQDGNLDAAVCYLGDHGLRIFPGLGDGTFGDPVEFALSGDTYDLEVFNLDNDPDLDVAVLDQDQDSVVVFRNESAVGAIAFTQLPNVPVGDSPQRLRSGMINNDAFVDLVVSNVGTNATTGRHVSVLLNDQAGSFSEVKLGDDLDPRVRPYGIALGLLNNDANLDLVVGDYDNTDQIVVWFGNGDGTFGAPAFYEFPNEYEPIDIALADYDQDGDLDAAVTAHSSSSRRVYIYPNNGDGTLGDFVEHDLGFGGDFNFIKSVDLDGNSWPDLITAENGWLAVLTNRAEGGIGFVQRRYNYNAPYGFDTGEVTGDGRIDLVMAEYSANRLRVLTGNAKALLTADGVLPGLWHGYGRGSLTDGNDSDYYSFTAVRGQRLTVAVDNTPVGGSNRYTRFILYDPEGNQISDNYMQNSSNRAGESGLYTIPRDGTYYVRFLNWANYFGEYRYRVSLSPADAQVESENNDSIGNADGINLSLEGNRRTGKMFGYAAIYDSNGDYFNLGNLAAGTEIDLSLNLPSNSTLVPILEIYDSSGTQKAAGAAGETTLGFTLSEGDDETYYARVVASDGRGLDAEYLLQVGLNDLLPPVVTGSDLPSGTDLTLLEGFSLTFNKDMLPSTITDGGNYTMISAGEDNQFSTPDDEVYPVAPNSYSGGLSASYVLVDAPLRPGLYEFRAFNLQDTFGNPLPVAFVQQFTIGQIAGFGSESEPNNTGGTADQIVLNADVAGLLTAAGRGRLSSSADIDYWQFEAEAGDLLIFEPQYPGAPATQGLRWYLTAPGGAVVFDRYIQNNHTESATTAPVTLGETGTYTFWVDDWYSIRTEYRFRLTLIRALEYESEDNGDIPNADPVSFTTANNIAAGDIAGFLSRNSELDYFNLGEVAAGNTVFVSTTLPDGSPLIPIVGIYNAGGVLQNEVNGAAGDDSAEVQITATGTYYALIRPNLTSAGIMSQYVLNVRILPTNAVNFPNLRVTSVTNPPAVGTQSGDNLTITFEVTNQGSLGTGVAAWTDRIVISTNDAFGDGDDLQLALVARNGALNPSESYLVNHQLAIPDGLFGDFYVFIQTDSSNAVDEILQEGDNTGRSLSQFNIALRDYPDLVIENFAITGPDGSGNYDLDWDLANRGSGAAPVGSLANLRVINSTTSQTILDVDVATAGALAPDQVEAQSRTLNTTVPGFYVVTVTADPDGALYEYGPAGHALAEQNSVQGNFQIFQFFDIAVAASPAEGGTVSGAGSYRDGAVVTVQAVPDISSQPYAFINWTENGAFVSSAATYQFSARAHRNLVAVFRLPQFQITGSVSPQGSGSISGLGTYALNADANLMANPAAGYLFDHWEENGANIGGNAALSFSVTGSRVLTAVFVEATPEHVVSFETDPAGLATIPGGGTYSNGQSITPTAPTPIEQGDFEYLFQRWELNGLFLSNQASFAKTFSTLDPATIIYTAVYEERSLKPEVASVASSYGTLIPQADDVVFTIQFDRTMDTAINPVLGLTSGNAPEIPAVPAGGTWLANNRFRSMPVAFGANNGGAFTLEISGGTDSGGRVMDPHASFGFTVDSLPPPNPVLVELSHTSNSVTVGWAGYSPPVDLSAFRYYIETTNFSDVSGLSAVGGGNASARQFEFRNLTPDQEYFVAVAAVDAATNSDPNVTALRIINESDTPPPVPFTLQLTGLDRVVIDWSGYDTSALVGLDGFRVFAETAPFSDVTGLVPAAELTKTTTSFELLGLDRTRTYHLAVVGYNIGNEFNPAVTTQTWSDPLGGSITTDLTLGGPAQSITMFSSATVDGGAVLTILPGTTLSFAAGTSLQINDGQLNANGTDLEPIHFTSTSETDSGQNPARGDWNGLTLADPVNVSELRHTWLRYGQGLKVLAGSPVIDGLYAVQNTGAGLLVGGSANFTTSQCSFIFNENGIAAEGVGSLTISDSVIKNNADFNVTQTDAASVDASSNWWGTSSASAIAAKLDGVVLADTPLTEEPVLGPAFALASGETQTGNQTIDLRLMTTNAVSYRLSEDSQFAGVLFADLYAPDETFRVSPYGFTVPFTLSNGAGLKDIFLQYQSDTGELSAPLQLQVRFITEGPVVNSFSLTEGQVIRRPMTVTATASAALGLKEIEFRVGGALVGRTTTSPLSFRWDPRSLSAGIVRVEALARDLAGKTSSRAVNVVLEPSPPPTPVISAPASGIVVGTNTITVSGTAEPNISLRVSRNGATVATGIFANVNGGYSVPNVPLVEGANNLVVTAYDSLGSSSTAPRTIFRDSGPPAALVLDPPIYNPAQRRLTVRWMFMEEGERPTKFQVFWNSTPFASPAEASGQSAITQQTVIDLRNLADGNYYFGVVGYDDADNPSAVSNLQFFSIDFSRPVVTISYGSALPAGPGVVPITVTSNESLQAPPLLSIRPPGLAPISVPLTGGPLNYTANYAVSDLSARTGTATVTISATDVAGNVFVGAPQGPALVFDMTRPTGILSFDSPPPIQTTSPVTLSVGLTLSEPAAAGTVPSLVFDPPVGANVPISLTGAGQVWTGSLELTSAMGKGDGFFLLNVQDQAGNTGTVLNEGGTLEVYNTAEPDPPGIPVGLTGEIRAGGEFLIGWAPVPRAQSYKIFREPGQAGGTPTVVIADGVLGTSYLDLPPADGFYRYAIVAQLRGVEGSPSGVLEGFSDRTGPDAPENVTATLLARGVEISFAAPSGGDPPASYRVYRNDTVIRNVNSPQVVVDLPPRGSFDYRVASVDRYGNENRSEAVRIDLLVSPVTNLQILSKRLQPNSMTWESNDGTVTGYNVYRDGVKQNGAPLPNRFYVDPIATGTRAVTYEVSALNANGDESVRRSLVVYPLSIALIVNPDAAKVAQPSRTRYFEDYRIEITNRAPSGSLALKGYEINRTVGGEDALSQSGELDLLVAPGIMVAHKLVVPSPTSRRDSQILQVMLRSEPDATGSSVSYEDVFTAGRPVDLGVNALLAPRDSPLAGGLTDFDVQIYNNGYAPMDVILGRANGSEPGDVSIGVLDQTGVEVSRTTFKGLGVPGITIDGNGNLFLTIQPGNHASFTLPGVFVPSALAGSGQNTEFRLRVDAIYYGLTSGNPIQSGPLSGSTRSNLIETPYYGTSSTDKPAYADSEVITITGQAIDRASGLPAPGVPLRIGFGARGYSLYEDVTTDANGDYSFEYTPPLGFSGQLNIWAAHPLIVDQLNQVTIEFLRMYVTPQRAEVIMSENDTLDFNLTLINPGDAPLSQVVPTARIFIFDQGAEVDINSIRLEQLGDPVDLEPNARVQAPLRLTADLGAPEDAFVELSLVSQEGASARFTATISLRPAVPVLSFLRPGVGYVDMSVSKGDINSQLVTLENLGLRPLEGVEVIPPQVHSWMSINLPRQPDGRILLPDIPVGGRISFNVVYTPPSNTPLGLYDDSLLVRGTNSLSDFQVNLFAQITSNQTGNVKFVFDNIFVDPVPNAKIRLRNPNLRQDIGPFFTDSNGEFTVPDLQEGPWSWKVTSAGHASKTGIVEVLANQTVLVEERLSKSLVTVEFTVVPVPFTDRYEIVIEQTFQTRVPFPVLVMDPPSFNFQDLPDEFEATVLVTLKNEGLIRMFDCTVEGSSSPDASFLPLITYFPELLPQQEVQVPFKFRFNANGLAKLRRGEKLAMSASFGDAVSDCFSAIFDPTEFLQGLHSLAMQAAANAQCQDGAPAGASAYGLVMFAGGFALGASIVGFAGIASFIGCVVGTLLGLGGGGGPVGGGGPGSGGGGTWTNDPCFPAGTMITVEDGATIPIERLVKGQKVLTGSWGERTGKVGDVIVRTSEDLYQLHAKPAILGGDLEDLSLDLTGDHLVWSDQRGWVVGRDLQIGEWLHDDHGNLYEVTSLEALEGTHTVYTIDVEGANSFYANHLMVKDLCGYQKMADRSLFAGAESPPGSPQGTGPPLDADPAKEANVSQEAASPLELQPQTGNQ